MGVFKRSHQRLFTGIFKRNTEMKFSVSVVLLTILLNYCHAASITRMNEIQKDSSQQHLSYTFEEKQRFCKITFANAKSGTFRRSCFGSICTVCVQNTRCCKRL